MMTEFSVVVPIHNEAQFLRFSLPSIFRLGPAEVVLVFDRCTNGSLEVAKEIVGRYGCSTKFIFVDEDCGWAFRVGYLRRRGYAVVENDVVLSCDADIILDGGLRRYVDMVGRGQFALVSFEYLDYPVSFRNLLKRLMERVKLPFSWFTGIYVFSRRAWRVAEDAEALKNVERSEDTYLHESIRKKYRTKCVLTDTVHLRPRENRTLHYLRGRLYWSVAHRSFLVTVLSALALFRPLLIKGYIHERFGYYS